MRGSLGQGHWQMKMRYLDLEVPGEAGISSYSTQNLRLPDTDHLTTKTVLQTSGESSKIR